MQELLPQPLGVDRIYSVTITDPATGNASSFSSSDTLTCVIWGGDDTAILCSPAASWVSASGGTAQFLVSAANTTALAVGKYRARLKVTYAASPNYTVNVWDGVLSFDAAPGSTAVLPSYCTYQDLTRLAPWIGDLQSQMTDQNGFAEQRGLAAQKMQEDLCKLYSNRAQIYAGFTSPFFGSSPAILFSESPSTYLRQVLTITTVTFSSVSGTTITLVNPVTAIIVTGSILNFGGVPVTLASQANVGDTTLSLLSTPGGSITSGTVATANNLIMRESTIRINAYYALYLICSSQVSPSSDNAYERLAKTYYSRYSQAWTGYRAELMPTPQGYPSIVIPCGVASMRM